MAIDQSEPAYKFTDQVVDFIKGKVSQNNSVSDSTKRAFSDAVNEARVRIRARDAKRIGEFAALIQGALLQMAEKRQSAELKDIYNNLQSDFHYIQTGIWQDVFKEADREEDGSPEERSGSDNT